MPKNSRPSYVPLICSFVRSKPEIIYEEPETVYMKADYAYVNQRPTVIPETDISIDYYYSLDHEKLEADEGGSSAGYSTVREMQTSDQSVEQVTGISVSTDSQYSYARVLSDETGAKR